MKLITLLAFFTLMGSAYGQQYFGQGAAPTWKAAVPNVGALPAAGNTIGDIRIETTAFGEYVWNGAAWQAMAGGGGGTVTSVSVVTANGLSGTVANPGTTPAITLSTSVNGIAKGNGTAFSTAVANTDYQAPISTSAAPAHQFGTGFTAPNTFTYAQPAFSDITGQVTAAQMLTLPSADLYVGTAGNQPAAVALSGDASITNAGNLTVANSVNRVYVDFLVGNDGSGTGSPIRPWKTLQHACSSIAPTINNPFTVYISGGNNDSDVGTITCPPNITLVGDYPIQVGVPLTITGGATNDSVGFVNLIFVGAVTWVRNDATVMGMSLTNTQFFSGPVFKQNGAGTASMTANNSVTVNLDIKTGGTGSFFTGHNFLGSTTFEDANSSAYYQIMGGYSDSAMSVSGGPTVYFSGMQADVPFGYTLTAITTANGSPVFQTDDGSIPASVVGTPTYLFTSQSSHLNYAPSTPANWSPSPSVVSVALDQLASRVPVGGAVSSVTASAPLASSGGTTPDISLTGIVATANGGTNHGNYTAGSVPFAGAGGTSLTENNANFFWDNATQRLGLGTATPNARLQVANGEVNQNEALTDSGGAGLIFNESSHTTVTGSNTTIGLQGVATATVDVGAVNDKAVAAVLGTTTRGNGADDGNLHEMDGAYALMFHNSGAAGTTDKVITLGSTFIHQQGTVTDLYDVKPESVPAGGTVTNHYGLYIEASPFGLTKKNWISGATMMGSGGFASPTEALELSGNLKMTGTIMDSAGTIAIHVQNRQLTYASGSPSVDWLNNAMYDATSVASIDWGNRFLIDNTGAVALDYSTNGTIQAHAAIDMNSNLIHNVTDPAAAQDAATKNYVDSATSSESVSTKVANYTVLLTDQDLIGDASGGTFSFTLPTSASSFTAGRSKVFTFLKSDSSANLVSISAQGADTIQGVATISLNTQYQSITVITDGTGAFYVK